MLTQRLGSNTQKNPEFIDSLIAEIIAHPGSCDEVWLATDYGFPSIEGHKESARILAEVADKFRKIGIRVSLQLSNSIGHGQYMAACDCSGLVYDGSPVEHMVGHDGTVAGYCFCWRGKHFRKYVTDEIRAYCSAIKPHTLWIDDDLRPRNHAPVDFGCFCDDCIRAFNEKYGSSFTREELVAAINSDIEWRKKHIEFIRGSLYDFTFEMGKAAHETAPECRLGYQHGMLGGVAGFNYDFIYDAMRDSTGIIPAHRPGGGQYDDWSPAGFVDKAEQIAFQNYLLPEYVTESRPEIESLPDIVFGKSIGGTCFETSFYLASGNNAMSYAMLMNDYEPMSWHGQMLGAFSEHREYWEKLCEVNNRSHQSGLKVVIPHEGYLVKSSKLFGYSSEYFNCAMPLRYLNIPVAMTRHDCDAFVLSAENAYRLTDAEVEALLARQVITDGEAVKILTDRGFDLGATAAPIDTSILSEFFSDHKVNGKAAGRRWGGRWAKNSDWELIGDKVEPLGFYMPTNGTTPTRNMISSAVFTTSKGGKWAAFFDMWGRGISTEKRDQYLNTLEYISGKRFAGELVTPIQAIVHPRVDANGKTVAVSVTNCTVADSGKLELIVRNPASEHFTFMGQYRTKTELVAERIGDGEYKLTIPDIHGWSVATVFAE